MNEYYNTLQLAISSAKSYDVNSYYIENKFPSEMWALLMKEVISSVDFETKDGLEICKLFEAIGYASKDGGLNFAIGAHTLAALIPFSIYASNELKEKYLQQLINGELIIANAITETEAGSDVFSMTSSATKTTDGYTLNGAKIFCSNIKEADLALVYMATDKEKGAHGGITTFIVDSSQFKVGQTFSKMGLRTCSIGELILENLSVSKSNILGEVGAGFGIFTTAMDWERIGLSAIYVGTMQRLFEQSVEYSKNRIQGGNTIGKYQAISHKIAEMKTAITACRLMIQNASKKLGKERCVSELASMCKLFVSENYIKVCENAMQIHGGNGYMEEYDIERSLRDAHASTIYSGTSEIQKNIIAKWSGL